MPVVLFEMSVKVNKDLVNERNKCGFSVEELTNYLDGGVNATCNRRTLGEFNNISVLSAEDKWKILSTKGLLDEVPEEYLSHKEKYESAVRKAVTFHRVMKNAEDPNLTEEEKATATYRTLITFAVFKENSPFALHFAMFIPTIASQANDEQKAYWLKRATNMQIIGTYAQTELGHGTFVRGLETTATYDPKTEEFVLHSPTLTSYKWWPGSLANTANYCVVMAHLYIKGASCGIQPFMVQVRDETTHVPLPGIMVGEIGAKLGFNTVNNGFLGFQNHRIPRDRMLMRNAQVLKDGTFKSSANSKLVYGTMVYVRVMIVNNMSNQLARAATIATRYSAIRRQCEMKPGEAESQILDYVTQQHKLFIAIASCHAIRLNAQWLFRMYSKVTGDIKNGKSDELPELHALACCLKAVSTADVQVMVERCRLACGGHGYMLSSNLPQVYGLVTAAYTYEGENTVLMLQTARYLVKMWEQATKGKEVSPSMAYLVSKTKEQKWEYSVDGIIKGFQSVAKGKLSSAVDSMRKYRERGLSPEDAWNMSSVRLVGATEAHCRAVILSTYKSEMVRTTASLSPPLRSVLNQLMQLYASYWALEKLGDLFLFTCISENDVQDLQGSYEELLIRLRPNAVGLVDAFDLRDEILNSTLGAYDGRVYERLMEEALKSPLNKEPINKSFQQYLKPFMQGKL